MQDSITIAEVGSIEKVSGSRIATPFGPPSPGSTPTKMPSTRPSIIRVSLSQVSSTWKPWNRSSNASILGSFRVILSEKSATFRDHAWSVSEIALERALGHEDVEGDLEGHEHRDREHEGGEQRDPDPDLPDPPHEPGDQHEARHLQAEELHGDAVQQGRHGPLQDGAELGAQPERLAHGAAGEQRHHQAIDAGGAHQDREIEREVAGLRAVIGPRHAG